MEKTKKRTKDLMRKPATGTRHWDEEGLPGPKKNEKTPWYAKPGDYVGKIAADFARPRNFNALMHKQEMMRKKYKKKQGKDMKTDEYSLRGDPEGYQAVYENKRMKIHEKD